MVRSCIDRDLKVMERFGEIVGFEGGAWSLLGDFVDCSVINSCWMLSLIGEEDRRFREVVIRNGMVCLGRFDDGRRMDLVLSSRDSRRMRGVAVVDSADVGESSGVKRDASIILCC